ncbi:MAG: di-heme oxidoredictase family protein [Pseudomonadota bacterium]
MRQGYFYITLLFIGSASFAETNLGDPHLNFIPRTTAESERILSVTTPTSDFSKAQKFEANSGGAATVRPRQNRDAFSQISANADFEKELEFKIGNGLFKKLWASSPSSTLASDGLGPIYNARSCQRCHIKDGRGHAPDGPEDNRISMLMRLSIPGDPSDGIEEIKDYLASLPDPVYGGQLQDFGVAGHAAEGRIEIEYEELPIQLSDGEMASLRKPTYSISNPAYGNFHPKLMMSPRVAPQMIGLGLLEAIPAADILALADETDEDNDGISGRPNIVWSFEYEQSMLGRFGLKAGMPTLPQQNADAFFNDIGISSPLLAEGWGGCTEAQSDCRNAIHGDGDERVTEIDALGMDLVNFYTRNLAVPARRTIDDPTVLKGKEVFYSTGCIACHTPSFVTHRLEDRPEQSFQLIWPYTDMLLHDMGDGLADNRPEARATGREWRTPPLWGIGLTENVSGHTQFLHDGRARNLLEAILWHGGEAEEQRDKVITMPKSDRDALIEFLESL